MDSEAWEWVVLILLIPVLCWPLTLGIISAVRKEKREKRKREAQRIEWATRATPRQHANQQPRTRSTARDRQYGEAHIALRAAWKDIIRLHGAECREDICILPSRQIEKGARWDTWDLAHDHKRGGAHDYLGPAHKVCNQAEALRRGVTWDGAPDLAELLQSVQPPSTFNDDLWAQAPRAALSPADRGAADVREMQRLLDQHREGVLSRAEFEAARARLLGEP